MFLIFDVKRKEKCWYMLEGFGTFVERVILVLSTNILFRHTGKKLVK